MDCARCRTPLASPAGSCVRCHTHGNLCSQCLALHQRGAISGHTAVTPDDGTERLDEVLSRLGLSLSDSTLSVCSTHAERITALCVGCSPAALQCALCASSHTSCARAIKPAQTTEHTSATKAARPCIISLDDAADTMRAHLLHVCASTSAWDPCVPPLVFTATGCAGAGSTVDVAARPPPRAVDDVRRLIHSMTQELEAIPGEAEAKRVRLVAARDAALERHMEGDANAAAAAAAFAAALERLDADEASKTRSVEADLVDADAALEAAMDELGLVADAADLLPDASLAFVCQALVDRVSSLIVRLRDLSQKACDGGAIVSGAKGSEAVKRLDSASHFALVGLRSLSLFSMGFSPTDMRHLAGVLRRTSQLRHLDVADNPRGLAAEGGGSDALAKALAALPDIAALDISANELGKPEIAPLAAALSAGSVQLRSLSVSSNNLGNPGFETLCSSLPSLSRLSVLDLGSNGASLAGAKALATALKGLPSLQSLTLNGNSLGDAGVTALVEGLSAVTALTTLRLRSVAMRRAGAKALAAVLHLLPFLSILDVSGNGFGNEGMVRLAEGLRGVATLTALFARGNLVGETGVTTLADSLLSSTPRLEMLDLRYNCIGNGGAASLAHAASRGLRSLTGLDLASADIGAMGAAALGEALPTLSALKHIDLSGNKFGDAAALALADVLSHMPCIESVALTDDSSSLATNKAIRRMEIARKAVKVGKVATSGLVI